MDIVKVNNSQVTPEGTRDKKLFNYDFYGEKTICTIALFSESLLIKTLVN